MLHKVNRIATSAPASLAGYVMQIYRGLFRLSEAPANALVGIETLDDVSVLTAGALISFEQDKLSLAPDSAPVDIRSKSLWKTLGIWTDALAREKSKGRTPTFLLATNRPLKGVLKELTAEGRTEDVNRRVLAELVRQGKSEPKPAKGSLQELINIVLNKPREALLEVLQKMQVEAGLCVLDLGLIERTIERLHLPDFLDQKQVHRALYGWVSDVIVAKWHSGAEAWITRSEFDRQLHTILSGLVRRRVSAQAARVIPISDSEKLEARTHRFVFHLGMIQMDPSQVDEELIHYIRFSKEKFRLLSDGYIPPEEWEARGDRLCEHWKTIFRREAYFRNRTEPAERAGMRIFYEIARHREPLCGEAMPEAYITVGHFHRLSDDDRVFWHPEFQKGKKK